MKTTDKVTDKAGNARPYFERALTDEDVRDNVKHAFKAAREVYDELIGGRNVTTVATKVATDKDVQDNLRTAIEELRSAAKRVQGKDAHKSRNSLLLLTGIALGVLFNPATGPATREWLKKNVLGEDDTTDFSGGSNGGPTAA
jgi:hypothetical protein